MDNNFWLDYRALTPQILSFIFLSYLSFQTLKIKARHKWTKRFLLTIFSVMIWIAGDILIQISINPNLFKLAGKILYTGIVFLPFFCFLFSLSYGGYNDWITTKKLILLSIIPFATLIIIYSDVLSPIMRVVTSTKLDGRLIKYTVQYGPWFLVHTISSYTMLFLGLIILLYSILVTSKLFAGQKIGLTIASIFPFTANILYLFGITGNNDYTTTAFTILVLALAVTHVKYKFLNIAPIARGVVFEHMTDPVIVLDQSDRIVDINTPATLLAQQEKISVLGKDFDAIIPELVFLLEKSQEFEEFKEDIGIPQNSPKDYFSVHVNKIIDKHRDEVGKVLVLRDITDKEQAKKALTEMNRELDIRVMERTADLQKELETNRIIQKALCESDERYFLAIQGANDGIWDWDLNSGKVFYSPRWKNMIGFMDHEIPPIIESWVEKVHPDDHSSLLNELSRHLDNKTDHFEHSHRISRKDGNYLWVRCRGMAKRGEDGIATRMSGSMTDISQQKEYEEQILFDAFHDQLTGLPNRAFIIERITHSIERAKRSETELFALIFLDIDKFKDINDTLGHNTGDQLLKYASNRISACLRSTDTISRFGGDEFVILIDSISSIEEVKTISDRIVLSLSEDLYLNKNEVSIKASLGIVIFSKQYKNADEILSDADIAMYQAKKNPYSTYEIFNTGLREKVERRIKLEEAIRHAIQEKQFELFYQPILNMKDETFEGFEALIRWRDPIKGYIQPIEFIPIAEETGLIIPIGQWVIKQVCKQIAEWKTIVPSDKTIVINMNLSTRQFSDPNLSSSIRDNLEFYNIEGHNLVIEVTESVFIEDKGIVSTILRELRELGIRVHIDDFGTGYSSLGYLNTFPFDALKIDRSFVNKISSVGGATEINIIKTIITLAQELGKDVIAEGVESKFEFDILADMGCDFFQGYFNSKPMDKTDTSNYLKMILCEYQPEYEERQKKQNFPIVNQ